MGRTGSPTGVGPHSALRFRFIGGPPERLEQRVGLTGFGMPHKPNACGTPTHLFDRPGLPINLNGLAENSEIENWERLNVLLQSEKRDDAKTEIPLCEKYGVPDKDTLIKTWMCTGRSSGGLPLSLSDKKCIDLPLIRALRRRLILPGNLLELSASHQRPAKPAKSVQL